MEIKIKLLHLEISCFNIIVFFNNLQALIRLKVSFKINDKLSSGMIIHVG